MRIAPRALLLLLPLALALTARPARAVDLSLDLRLAMAGGGDALAEVVYTDGSEDVLHLGTCFSLTAGPAVTVLSSGAQALELTALVGFGGWSTGPENTDDRIGLTRFPLELLAFYRLTPEDMPVGVRLGGGLAYHLIGGATGSGSLSGLDIDIENALGWVGEVSVTYDSVYFGVRYTGMTYRVEPGIDMDASSVGVMVGVLFPI